MEQMEQMEQIDVNKHLPKRNCGRWIVIGRNSLDEYKAVATSRLPTKIIQNYNFKELICFFEETNICNKKICGEIISSLTSDDECLRFLINHFGHPLDIDLERSKLNLPARINNEQYNLDLLPDYTTLVGIENDQIKIVYKDKELWLQPGVFVSSKLHTEILKNRRYYQEQHKLLRLKTRDNFLVEEFKMSSVSLAFNLLLGVSSDGQKLCKIEGAHENLCNHLKRLHYLKINNIENNLC